VCHGVSPCVTDCHSAVKCRSDFDGSPSFVLLADDVLIPLDIDTGSLVVVDLDHLGALARILPWERYDHALQSPNGDDSRFMEICDELGGAYFGIISSDASTPFQGDGTYRLRKGAPHAVENS
jgi:hypothetical protein